MAKKNSERRQAPSKERHSHLLCIKIKDMSKKIAFVFILSLGMIFNSWAQRDSVVTMSGNRVGTAKKWLLPAGLISSGLVVHYSDGKLGKHYWQNKLQQCCPTQTKIDNYIQYTPIVFMYGADIAGIPAQHDACDQTKYLLMSELLNTLIVRSLKPLMKVRRPDDSNYHSMPSGHTSNTFTSATVLYREFKDTAPYVAYSGYLVGTTVAALRMTNNRHWLSDVLVGAGIGTFSALIIYHFKPLKNWHPFQKQRITILPNLSTEIFAVNLVIGL